MDASTEPPYATMGPPLPPSDPSVNTVQTSNYLHTLALHRNRNNLNTLHCFLLTNSGNFHNWFEGQLFEAMFAELGLYLGLVAWQAFCQSLTQVTLSGNFDSVSRNARHTTIANCSKAGYVVVRNKCKTCMRRNHI